MRKSTHQMSRILLVSAQFMQGLIMAHYDYHKCTQSHGNTSTLRFRREPIDHLHVKQTVVRYITALVPHCPILLPCQKAQLIECEFLLSVISIRNLNVRFLFCYSAAWYEVEQKV